MYAAVCVNFHTRTSNIDRVTWPHSNLWSRYSLHVVRHDVILCEDLSRYYCPA